MPVKIPVRRYKSETSQWISEDHFSGFTSGHAYLHYLPQGKQTEVTVTPLVSTTEASTTCAELTRVLSSTLVNFCPIPIHHSTLFGLQPAKGVPVQVPNCRQHVMHRLISSRCCMMCVYLQWCKSMIRVQLLSKLLASELSTHPKPPAFSAACASPVTWNRRILGVGRDF